MKVKSRIENMVCRIDFKQGIYFDEKTARKQGITETEHLQAYIYNHPKLDIKMMIFQTGEVILSGAKDAREIESAFWNLKKKLKDIGVKIAIRPDTEIEVQNVLATGNIRDYLPDLGIDLEKLADSENAVYDPKKFPTVFLSYLLHDCKATAMLFPSGKVLIGDVKTREDANLVLEKVIDQVRY